MHNDIEQILFSKEQISARTRELGKQLSEDYAGKNPLLICILKGSSLFFADLVREISVPVYFDFMSISSYGSGTVSSGEVKLIKDLAIFEDKIFQSLRSGGKEYYKPASIKAISRYEDPLGIQGIKASLVWNEVRNRDLAAIDLEAKNNIDIVKTNITPGTIEKIKYDFPDEYERLRKLLNGETNKELAKILKGEITTIAVPRDVKTPEWVTHLINYTEITNDNIKNFPVESIGLMRMDKTNVNYSNILKL